VSRKIEKAEDDWRQELSPEQYRVLREKGTERAFTGKYWNEKAAGTYVCAGCGAPLYESDTKFDSGTGWPSFYQAVSPEAVTSESDATLGMRRTELLCACCGGHLGHVFEDGPAPTGQRHCINSAALKLKPSEEK
jgi:peptide-methionine (R)-S-oxide reductase